MKLIELLNPSMFTDSYKLSHKEQVPPGTTLIYGHLTPRSNQRFLRNYSNHDGKLVVFGITYFLQTFKYNWDTYFFSRKWEELEVELIDLLGSFLGYSPESISHFKALHELGYLPLEIKALSEGSLVNMGVPYLTVKNTHPDFAWLSNYIEPYILNTLSPTTTAATITREFAKLREEYYLKTVSDHSGKDYHLHNFSYRGCHGHEMGSAIGMAHLLFTRGTDTLGAVQMARYFYQGENVANSVPALEHSTATLGILNSSVVGNKLKGEEINLKRLLTEVYPSGIFSYITDSFDFWSCITVILPNLKDIIKARNGKLVIRHDSGNAVTNLIGYNIKEASTLEEFENIKSSLKQDEALKYNDLFYTLKEGILEEISEAESKGIIEALYDIFGGSVNDKGFKELDPCIGAIYGDGISYSRLEQIYAGLEKKGFSINNVVIALGAYTLSTLNDRDQFGQTIKGSVGVVNNSIIPIFKDPATDPGKRSIQGFLKVIKEGEDFKVLSDVSPLEEKEGELISAFLNGDLLDTYKKTFKEIRDNLGFVINS